MSAEIERYYPRQNPLLQVIPEVAESEPKTITNTSDNIRIFVNPDVKLVVTATSPNDACFRECPIVKRGLTDIMDATDEAVVKSLVNWVEGVHDACKAGPKKSVRPRFFIVGSEVEIVTCSSFLAKNHSKLRTSRNIL